MSLPSQTLLDLEQNIEIKKSYATIGSFGQNKILAVPVVVGILTAFSSYFFYDLSRTDPDYHLYMVSSVAILIICIVAAIIIQRKAKQVTITNIDSVPVCIARKMYGNDAGQIYFGIYTLGNRRHDAGFIEEVAQKIFQIEEQPDAQLTKKIADLFAPRFEETNGPSVSLPHELCGGEEVYVGQFNFRQFSKEMKNKIAADEDKFAVIVFNRVTAQLIQEKDLPSV